MKIFVVFFLLISSLSVLSQSRDTSFIPTHTVNIGLHWCYFDGFYGDGPVVRADYNRPLNPYFAVSGLMYSATGFIIKATMTSLILLKPRDMANLLGSVSN